MTQRTEPPVQPRDGYTYINTRRCKGCGATIHWWETVAGKPSPHDQDGTSHFVTCPVAQRFRRDQEESAL